MQGPPAVGGGALRGHLAPLFEDVVAVLDVERADGAARVTREARPQRDAVVLLLERVVHEVQPAEGVVLDLRDRADRVALPALVALVEEVLVRAVRGPRPE